MTEPPPGGSARTGTGSGIAGTRRGIRCETCRRPWSESGGSVRLMTDVIFAAGAVVWRPTAGPPDGDGGSASAPGVEVLLVHRPKYDDWSLPDRKSTRLNSSHRCISYAVFCLKK